MPASLMPRSYCLALLNWADLLLAALDADAGIDVKQDIGSGGGS